MLFFVSPGILRWIHHLFSMGLKPANSNYNQFIWRFADAHGVRIDYTRFESDGRLFGDGIDTFSWSYVF